MEQARLQGTWREIAAERDGAPAPDLVGHQLTFTESRFQITLDGTLLYGGTYAADPSAQPAHIDFRQEEGSALRGEWRGIYRFEASGLEIVDNAHDMSKPRPTVTLQLKAILSLFMPLAALNDDTQSAANIKYAAIVKLRLRWKLPVTGRQRGVVWA